MKELIIIAGPTACGKTSVSIELAKLLDTEIISADSMQVYRGMNIGTAKVTPEESQGIKHHLIDCLDPDEEFSAAVFKKMAENAIEEIHSKGRIPIIAGGTGFYINALLYDASFDEIEPNKELRAELANRAEKEGADKLYTELLELDPRYAAVVHPNNVKKVIHAIEYITLTGELFSDYNDRQKAKKAKYDSLFCVLDMDRAKLYDRINRRVDIMVENGLENEVRGLLNRYSSKLTSMQGLGYKEMAEYILGNCTFDEAVNNIKLGTRHFAKRQLTWFRHRGGGKILNMDEFSSPLAAAEYIRSEI